MPDILPDHKGKSLAAEEVPDPLNPMFKLLKNQTCLA